MIIIKNEPFPNVVRELRSLLLQANAVNVGEWQAQRGDERPTSHTLELEDVSFDMRLPESPLLLRETVKPNVPWAEDHFRERISTIPHNPPPSSAWWPHKMRDHEEHLNESGQFSHTYPERYWPALDETGYHRQGIRYGYGDLGDLVTLLAERPNTRQAYLPVWFPEDLRAAGLGDRVPCTLGYHFLIREGALKVVYYIRSCDFLRHFRDDVYMTGRLAQWICDELNERGVQVIPYQLVMHISSLHVFEADRQVLAYQATRDRGE